MQINPVSQSENQRILQIQEFGLLQNDGQAPHPLKPSLRRIRASISIMAQKVNSANRFQRESGAKMLDFSYPG